MSIKVTWTKAQGAAAFTGYSVYRADTEAGVYSAPAIFTSSNIDVLEYNDTDPALIDNKIYYYGVEVKTANSVFRSIALPIASVKYPGVGGATLTSGNAKFGFIGTVDKGLYYKAAEAVKTLIVSKNLGTMSVTNPQFVNGGEVVLNKFIYNGQLIYVPSAYQDYLTAALRAQVIYDSILKEMIESPMVITYGGNSYKIVLLTKEQMFDMHFSSTLVKTGRSRRFVKTQTVMPVTSGLSGGWFVPTAANECWYSANSITADPVYGDLANTTGRSGVPVIWGLVPIPLV